MSAKIRNLKLYSYSPLVQIIISLAIIVGVGIFLMVVLLIPGFIIFHADVSILVSPSGEISRGDLSFLRYMVIVQDISIFIVPALIIMKLIRPENQEGPGNFKLPGLIDFTLVVILAFSLIPLTDFTGRLNAGLHLPEWMSGLERWVIRKENETDDLIGLLIVSDNIRTLLMNIAMIALLPAIGEEMIFRGIFQKILYRLFRSGHASVWFTAIIFSAIHFQFLGFIPRLILGLVFGYLFLWSGTLWLPVLAHFVNNAIPVVGTYIHVFDNTAQPQALPDWNQALSLLFPVLICAGIMLYFKYNNRNKDIFTNHEISC
jgi:membrane protease YdiL (CAAX protease family)